jgi:putative ABC transport system permease protein
MLILAARNLVRRPLRLGLALTGLALAIALLAGMLAFTGGYEAGLRSELDGMGIQLMIVPLGCPYDATARALKGRPLEDSLPAAVLDAVRRDDRVAVAAPMLIAAFPQPQQRRTDLWVGIDASMRQLKPGWHLKAGSAWFTGEDDVLLGAEAAETELRAVGDTLYNPAAKRRHRVCGILERTGTSDDNLFFLPLGAAQQAFGQSGRLSAVAVRLKDPAVGAQVAKRFAQLPGAQVVTLTEMMGTFLNLVGAARLLVAALVLVALAVGTLSIFNLLMAAVLDRQRELAVLRAVGASVSQIFGLIALEALLLAAGGIAAGLLAAAAGGSVVETVLRAQVPLAPDGRLLQLSAGVAARAGLFGIASALAAALYPAWRASRSAPAAALQIE